MKRKSIILAAVALAAAIPTVAAYGAEMPEALYLMGRFNGWTLPSKSKKPYQLLPTSEEGVYSGTFDIRSNALYFKVVTDRDADWSDHGSFWGAPTEVSADYYLFCDRPLTIGLVSDEKSGASSEQGAIYIRNWQGGSVTVTASYRPGESLDLRLEAPGQPEAISLPEKCYVIGDFNSWQVPSESGDNGAIPISGISGEEGSEQLSSVIDLPETSGFLLYLPEGSGEKRFLGADFPEFDITSVDGKPSWVSIRLIRSEVPDRDHAIRVRDWKGGELEFSLDIENFLTVYMLGIHWDKAPATPKPEGLYLVTRYDDREPVIRPLDDFNEFYNMQCHFGEGSVSTLFDRVSMFISTENSANPAPENMWGISINPSGIDYWNSPEYRYPYYSLVKGGYPFEVSAPSPSESMGGWLDIYWPSKLIYVLLLPRPRVENLYLIGSLQGWDISNGDLRLERLGGNVFQGEFEVPDPKDVVFRFYTALGDWENGSIGSQLQDTPISVSLPYEGQCISGKGSWRIPDFPGTTLKVLVNLEAGALSTVQFSSPSGVVGVPDIANIHYAGGVVYATEPTLITVYTPAGRTVASSFGKTLDLGALQPGLYIVRAGERTIKVMR